MKTRLFLFHKYFLIWFQEYYLYSKQVKNFSVCKLLCDSFDWTRVTSDYFVRFKESVPSGDSYSYFVIILIVLTFDVLPEVTDTQFTITIAQWNTFCAFLIITSWLHSYSAGKIASPVSSVMRPVPHDCLVVMLL